MLKTWPGEETKGQSRGGGRSRSVSGAWSQASGHRPLHGGLSTEPGWTLG